MGVVEYVEALPSSGQDLRQSRAETFVWLFLSKGARERQETSSVARDHCEGARKSVSTYARGQSLLQQYCKKVAGLNVGRQVLWQVYLATFMHDACTL